MVGIDVIIRDAVERDASSIHAMVVALAHHVGKPEYVVSTIESIRRHGFSNDRAFEALIAERAGKAVGLALFFGEFSTWRGRRGLYVQDLFVAESERSSGLGRRLLAELAARGATKGADYIRLSVEAVNMGAAKFYERLGFEERTTERTFVLSDSAFRSLAGL